MESGFPPQMERRLDAVEGEPIGIGGDVAGGFQAVGDPASDLPQDSSSPGVVAVDDHPLRTVFSAGGKHLGKEAPLGLEVVFHRP